MPSRRSPTCCTASLRECVRLCRWAGLTQRQVEDEARLPITWSFVQETKRYRPVARMAVPHEVEKEEVIEGYVVPVGSLVVPNIYAINLDPDVYNEPSVFKPSRWLDEDGRRIDYKYTNGRGQNGFGYGRRVCPCVALLTLAI
jgi:cytochrome P450